MSAPENKTLLGRALGFTSLVAARPSYAIGLILVVAIAARFASFSGYFGSDDAGYAELAHEVAQGTMEIPYQGPVEVFSLRVGVYRPVAVAFRLFGVGEASMLLFPLLSSLATALCAYFAGRLMFDDHVALLAGLLWAVLPLDARTASMLMPDAPAALLAAVGTLVCWRAVRSEESQLRQGLMGGLAGACFVGAWLTKTSVVYLVPFVAGYLLLMAVRRGRIAVLAGCALASLAGIAAEGLTYQSLTGSFLYRFETVQESYEDSGAVWRNSNEWGRLFIDGPEAAGSSGEYLKVLIKRVVADGPRQLLFGASFALIPALALLTVAYAAYRRWGDCAFVGAWFVSVLAMFNFSSASLVAYRPLPLADRFVYLQLFPAVLLTAVLLRRLVFPAKGDSTALGTEAVRERFFWGLVAAVAVFVACGVGVARNRLDGPASTLEREVARHVGPSERLISDARTIQSLQFFWGFPAETEAVPFAQFDLAEAAVDDYVLVNEERLGFLEGLYDYQRPEYLAALVAASERVAGEVPGLYRVVRVPEAVNGAAPPDALPGNAE